MNATYLNGQPAETIELRHRALAYGDGLFETCRVDNGRLRFWADHRDRLNEGAGRLGLAWTDADLDRLEVEIASTLAEHGEAALCKLMLLRRSPGRGYDYDPATQSCDRVIQLSAFEPPAWHRGTAAVISATVPASVNPVLAGLKHLNRLDSVLARQQARQADAQEALLALPDGRLVEGSMSNCFIKQDGQWRTPRLDQAGVNGIIRRRWLRRGDLVEADSMLADLPGADALLLGNALMGLVPVARLDNQPLSLPSSAELAHLRDMIGLPSD